jgi:hypothetical protein
VQPFHWKNAAHQSHNGSLIGEAMYAAGVTKNQSLFIYAELAALFGFRFHLWN